MATAFVKSKRNTSGTTGTTCAVTFDTNVTAGNLICGSVSWNGGTTTVLTSVSDGLGNTYTIVQRVTDAARCIATFYAKNISGGACTVTATFSSSQTFITIIVHEASGCDTTAPLDKNAGQAQAEPGTGDNAATSGAQTTTVDGCYIYGVTIECRSSTNYTAGTGYTLREVEGPNETCASEDRVQATAGSVAATYTKSVGDKCITMMLAFKPQAAGGLSISLVMANYRRRRL
jgi:hypothetical protein